MRPLGDAVTVYEVAAPPDPVPGTTVTVALPLPETAVGAAGTLGALSIHCALRSVFVAGMTNEALAA